MKKRRRTRAELLAENRRLRAKLRKQDGTPGPKKTAPPARKKRKVRLKRQTGEVWVPTSPGGRCGYYTRTRCRAVGLTGRCGADGRNC